MSLVFLLFQKRCFVPAMGTKECCVDVPLLMKGKIVFLESFPSVPKFHDQGGIEHQRHQEGNASLPSIVRNLHGRTL